MIEISVLVLYEQHWIATMEFRALLVEPTTLVRCLACMVVVEHREVV